MSDEVDRHVLKRYEVAQKLGKGAYGIVWKAIDKKSKETVALKKIFDAFQNATDAQRTYREVIFLQQMGDHDNIVQLCNVLKADNHRDIYLVFEYMETDLHAVIRANILQDIHKKYIMYQSFKAIKYMHSAKLVHRDLKPSNMLLNAECLMKIADFGLARSLLNDTAAEAEHRDVLTDYVATRWYRAPEILLGSNSYGKSVDMWSLGCIFGEMLAGKPLFPGKNTLDQLQLVGAVIGAPDVEEIAKLDSVYTLEMLDGMEFPMGEPKDNGSRERVRFSRAKPPAPGEGGGNPWEHTYSKVPPEAIALMKRLMRYDPDQRITPDDGLTHPYCEQFHDAPTEPVCENFVGIHHSDNKKYQTQLYRDALYALVDDVYDETKKKKR